MSSARYVWRELNQEKRAELLEWRRKRGRPWHSPPNRANHGCSRFHISAACYEHAAHIGFSTERMKDFSDFLIQTFAESKTQVHAWCVLPNHYHALVDSEDILGLLRFLGQLHGRTSHRWNGEENKRGRQIFHRATERAIRSERHFWATMNYVHNNPVHHGYVKLWNEWPWSSAAAYLESVGREEAERVWKSYPVRDYGAKWDAAGI